MNAIKLLDGLERTSDVLYALGYSWYLMPGKGGSRACNAKTFLTGALAGNGGNHYAALYLAHLYYDEGRYQKALVLLEGLPRGAFKKKGQAWRDVKVAELRLCILLCLGRIRKIRPALDGYIDLVACEGRDQVPLASELGHMLCKISAHPGRSR